MIEFLRFCSVVLAVSGFVQTANCLVDIPAMNNSVLISQTLILMLLYGIVPMLLGFSFFKRFGKQLKKETREKTEIALIKLATDKSGRITPAEVSVRMNMPLHDAKSLLSDLYYNNVFELHLSEEGNEVYKLNGFNSSDETGELRKIS